MLGEIDDRAEIAGAFDRIDRRRVVLSPWAPPWFKDVVGDGLKEDGSIKTSNNCKKMQYVRRNRVKFAMYWVGCAPNSSLYE